MDPIVTGFGIIGQGGSWTISGGNHTQSIIQGWENIIHSDVITHVLKNPDKLTLESDSFLFIPGAIILLWLGLLAPIRHTLPLLARKGSSKDATMSVCALSELNRKESLSSVNLSGFVRTWVMTSLQTMFSPPWIMLWVWLPLLISRGPPCPMIPNLVTTGSMSVDPSSEWRNLLPRWDPLIGSFKFWVSMIGSFLAAGFSSKSLESVIAFNPVATVASLNFQGD